jgi:hypothetical protein
VKKIYSIEVGSLIFLILVGALLGFIYTAIPLLTWALIRYRLPVDAVLIPFAAFLLSDLFHRMTRKTRLIPTN